MDKKTGKGKLTKKKKKKRQIRKQTNKKLKLTLLHLIQAVANSQMHENHVN